MNKIKEYQNKQGQIFNNFNYISVTENQDDAIFNAFKGSSKHKLPVLFDFILENEIGKDYLRMNTNEQSVYPNEGELVLFEGICYLANSIEKCDVVNPITKI